jgi:hypothetical protein
MYAHCTVYSTVLTHPPAPTEKCRKIYIVPVAQSTYHTYVEYRAVYRVFQNIDPSPPPHHLSTQRVCPPPAPKAGGYTLAGR